MNRNVVAWVGMFAAIALHVADEALTDFLPFYNGLVHDLRLRLGFFPMPTFSFGLWLGGLIALIVAGFGISPLIGRGGRPARIVATLIGVLMIFNAGGHKVGSIFAGRLLPGFRSSPLLFLASAYMVWRGLHRQNWGGDGLSRAELM